MIRLSFMSLLFLIGILFGCGRKTETATPASNNPSSCVTDQSCSIRLKWTAPTQHMDGAPANDLQGYRVYYGTTSFQYDQTIDVGNVTSYTITGLGSGTYYFNIKAYNPAGDSPFAWPELSKTFTSH